MWIEYGGTIGDCATWVNVRVINNIITHAYEECVEDGVYPGPTLTQAQITELHADGTILTVEEIFSEVENIITNHELLEIVYEENYGYPRRYSWNEDGIPHYRWIKI